MAVVNLGNLITRGEGLRDDLAFSRGVRSALPGSAVGQAQRQILGSNVIKGQAGAEVARHGADVATHESPEAIVNRARRDRERQIGRELDTERRTKELQARADDVYYASGGAQGAGERAKGLGEAMVKLRQGQAAAQDIANIKSLSPPAVGTQIDSLQKDIESLLKVELPSGETVADLTGKEFDKGDTSLEATYYHRYRNLLDQIYQLARDGMQVSAAVR